MERGILRGTGASPVRFLECTGEAPVPRGYQNTFPRASTLIGRGSWPSFFHHTWSCTLLQGQMWLGMTWTRSPSWGARSQAVTSTCACSSLSFVIIAAGYSATYPWPLSGAGPQRSLVSVLLPASSTTCPGTAVLTTVVTIFAAQSSSVAHWL